MLPAPATPPLDIPPLPLLSCPFCEDLDAVLGVLGRAWCAGYPHRASPHALGGEVKVLDPDGNAVLLGRRERPASRAPAGDEGLIRFCILRRPRRWCPRGTAPRRPARSPARPAGAARTRPR